jgi:integrase
MSEEVEKKTPLTLILEDKEGNSTVNEYIQSVKTQNENTARIYQGRLVPFREFVRQSYNLSLDELITTLTQYSHGPRIDPYNLLASYVFYLKTTKTKDKSISPLTTKLLLSTVRNYLETFGVELSSRRLKLKVKTPRVIRSDKEALTKEDIRIILDACSYSLKLKTYILFLAATGCRATEALSIRECDMSWSKDPVTIFLRGEYTKTKVDRYLMLTSELVSALKLWLDYKYRTRKVHYYDKKNGKSINEKRTPVVNKELYIFSSNCVKNPSLEGLYYEMVSEFEHTLDRLGGRFGEWENDKKRRRKITLHSMRRFVLTTISNLGYHNFAEIYLGHSYYSTYYRMSEKEKVGLFKKIEPYLTFLDQTSLERKGVDLSNRLETVERENRELKTNRSELEKRLDHLEMLAKRFVKSR